MEMAAEVAFAPTFTADKFVLVGGSTTCYRCNASLHVGCVVLLPQPHRQPYVLDAEDSDDWPADYVIDLREIAEMTGNLEIFLSRRFPLYRKTFSYTAQASYWMHHCPNCDAHQGAFYLHHPDGPFFPSTPEQEGLLSFELVHMPIAVNATAGCGPLEDATLNAFPQFRPPAPPPKKARAQRKT